ncbi:MAG: 16S rRNA (cytosine(1402)-N(4))-methyltransferase RsmH [Candidatus Omnitrophota bacterium]
MIHKSVLLKEVIEALKLFPGKIIADATIGLGGHAEAILEKIVPGGKLIGIDKDIEALKIADTNLRRFEGSYILVHDDFKNLKAIFEKVNIEKADGFLCDLGVSSLQLDKAQRGFSIRYDAPLDMRMNTDEELTASYLVNKLSEAELDWILKNYGEERFHKRVAKAIVRERKAESIKTTGRLVEVILRSIPYKGRHGRVHPATRTFQALRIAVNKELDALKQALDDAIFLLRPSGLICVISYHSLEDRIVKEKFKVAKANGVLELVTKKPMCPSEREIKDNPRSRSAKLRIAKKL